jgi:hypothetical protein
MQDMYNAIKSQQILQPQGSMLGGRASTSALSPGQGHALMRNRSVRGGPPDRLTSLKRGSIRGLHSLMSTQAGISPYSSNSSIDGRSSPAPSFANSAHEVGFIYFFFLGRFKTDAISIGIPSIQSRFPCPHNWIRVEFISHDHPRIARRR